MPLSPSDVATLAQLACLIEATAAKPGNVSPGRSFRDMRYEDFLLSALAIGPAMARAGQAPLGVTVFTALDATRQWTRANTNLGLVLLLAPLARAAQAESAPLRERLRQVLRETSVDDAVEVYAAIREAQPGGMGRSPDQDLSQRPTLPLLEAMRLAGDRDTIAREYVTDFAVTFETGLPALRAARGDGLDWTQATVETYLAIIGSTPDTLVARKCGWEAASEISRRAREVQALGGIRTEAGRLAADRFDADLRDVQNSRNPGTSADLTAASIFVALLEAGGP